MTARSGNRDLGLVIITTMHLVVFVSRLWNKESKEGVLDFSHILWYSYACPVLLVTCQVESKPAEQPME